MATSQTFFLVRLVILSPPPFALTLLFFVISAQGIDVSVAEDIRARSLSCLFF